MESFQKTQRKSEQHSQTIIQAQLEVGKEDDEHEKEANDLADKVMRMSDDDGEKEKKMGEGVGSKIRMMHDGRGVEKMKDNEDTIRMKSEPSLYIRKMSDGNGSAILAPKKVEQEINNSRGNGQSLPENTQEELGGKMNVDLSDVGI